MEGSSLLSLSCSSSSPHLKPHLSFFSSSSLLFGKSHLLGLIPRTLVAHNTLSFSYPQTALCTSSFPLDEALEKPSNGSADMLPKIDKSGRFCSPRAARELALSRSSCSSSKIGIQQTHFAIYKETFGCSCG